MCSRAAMPEATCLLVRHTTPNCSINVYESIVKCADSIFHFFIFFCPSLFPFYKTNYYSCSSSLNPVVSGAKRGISFGGDWPADHNGRSKCDCRSRVSRLGVAPEYPSPIQNMSSVGDKGFPCNLQYRHSTLTTTHSPLYPHLHSHSG